MRALTDIEKLNRLSGKLYAIVKILRL